MNHFEESVESRGADSENAGKYSSSSLDGPILVGVDWHPESQKALRWTSQLARRMSSKVILVHAISPWVGIEMAVPPFDYDAYRVQVRARVDGWAKALGDLDHEKRVLEDSPAGSLLKVADEVDPSLIVVGAHARGGWSPPLLGSVAAKLIHVSRHPVAVVPESELDDQTGLVVVGVDGSTHSERALRWAASSAFTSGRDIHVVSVFPRDLYAARPHFEAVGAGDEHGRTARSLRQLTDRVAAETGRRITSDLEFGSPVDCLVSVGEEAFAIVLGKSGHGALSRAILGSTGRAVATHSPVPVVFVS